MFLAVGAHLSKRQDIPARDAGRIYDALQFLKEAELGGDAEDRPPCRDIRRRQYRDGRRAHGRRLGADPVIIYRRTRNRCRRTPSKPMRRSRKASRFTGCARSRRLTARRSRSKSWGSTRTGFRNRPAKFETLEADSRHPRAWPGHRHHVLRNVPGIEFRKDGTVVVGPTCRPAVPACSPAATWCRSTGR